MFSRATRKKMHYFDFNYSGGLYIMIVFKNTFTCIENEEKTKDDVSKCIEENEISYTFRHSKLS